jgi:hypothetical protein
MEPTLETNSFWTVLLSDLRLSGGRAYARGHFAYVTIGVVGTQKRIQLLWLTPEDKPFELELPKPLFPSKRLDMISMKDIEERFVELLETLPVSVIPEAPLPIPAEKLPPSTRRKVLNAARKAREERINRRFDGPRA